MHSYSPTELKKSWEPASVTMKYHVLKPHHIDTSPAKYRINFWMQSSDPWPWQGSNLKSHGEIISGS